MNLVDQAQERIKGVQGRNRREAEQLVKSGEVEPFPLCATHLVTNFVKELGALTVSNTNFVILQCHQYQLVLQA